MATAKPKSPARPATGGSIKDLTVSADAPKNPLAGFFKPADEFALPEGAIVKSMSPLLKPADFPVGMVLVGVFTKIFTTNPTPKKQGEGVEIIAEGQPTGIALPAVATIRQGLEITGVGDNAKSPFLGRTVAIQRMSERLKSKKGQDAWHFICAIYPDTKPKIENAGN